MDSGNSPRPVLRAEKSHWKSSRDSGSSSRPVLRAGKSLEVFNGFREQFLTGTSSWEESLEVFKGFRE